MPAICLMRCMPFRPWLGAKAPLCLIRSSSSCSSRPASWTNRYFGCAATADSDSSQGRSGGRNADRSSQRPSIVQQGRPSQSASLKNSKRTHEHPSKEREKARQAQHERKAKRWQAGNAPSEASGDWSEQYFDEKWTHKHGRLSDWNPPRETPQEDRLHTHRMNTHRSSAAHQTRQLQQQSTSLKKDSDDVFAESEPVSKQPPSDSSAEAASSRGSSPTTGSMGETSGSRRQPGGNSILDRQSSGGLEWRQEEEQLNRWRFYATCHPGLEEVVASELRGPAIRAQDVAPGQSGVSFWGEGLEAGYRACLWLRCAIRVLVLLAEGPISTNIAGGDALYHWTRQAVDWPELIQRNQRFSVEARLRDCPTIPSTMLVTTRIRDAICDAVRDARGEKLWPPNADHPADMPLYAVLYRNMFSLYRDMAGSSLHRRGYRSAMHRASLNESAAAGLLSLAGWPRQGTVFADPMCGSGTFLIEAANMALERAPGGSRQWWPFQTWPDFESHAWRQCRTEAEEREHAAPKFEGMLLGNDAHEGALSLARRDAHASGVSQLIDLSHGTCGSWKPKSTPQFVITNPPWGNRLGADQEGSHAELDWSGQSSGDSNRLNNVASTSHPEVDLSNLEAVWQDLGAFLKGQCPNAEAYILSGNKEITATLWMKVARRFPVGIGGVDCRLYKYHILPPKPARQPAGAQVATPRQ